ncbi:MAG: hypothetical protein J5525_00035 [Lachnospiraceae bacterium]|nr:hypothetical protein [Lachnospiraceae bacterium]
MDHMISKNKAILYTVISFAVMILMLIWPLKLLNLPYTAKSDEIMVKESDPISVEYNMTQMFEGIGGSLNSVDLLVCNDMAGQIITFRLYDENHAQIFEVFYTVPEDFIAPDFVNIPVRFDMDAKKEYSFIIEGLTTDLYCAYEDRDTSTSPVNYFMAYGGAELPGYDLIVRYNYSCQFSWWQIVLTILAFAVLFAVLVYCLKNKKDSKISLKKLLRIVFDPIIVIGIIMSFYVILIRKLFGIDTKNNLFLFMGISLLWFIPAYLINFTDLSFIERFKERLSFKNVSRCLRIIAIATTLWYCYEYMNGLYDIFHYYSISKIVVAFLFVLISTFERKELLNLPNAIWLVAGPILGYMYYLPQKGVEELGELYRLNGWVIAVGGFVIINIVYTIIRLIKHEIKTAKIDKAFAIPFMIFALGICILSNGRYWPFMLVVMCLLLIYRLWISEGRVEFSKDLCLGIILNFYMMVYFSVRHRPYYFYKYYRYNMGFHTVTMTAYYLAMVVSAAWMRLYARLRSDSRLESIVGPMFTFGMASSYLIFTMSRTGFLSVSVMIIFALIITALWGKLKKVQKFTTKQILIMIVTVVYMFPVTFFLTDVVPRLANDPVVFEYEQWEYSFQKGMPYADFKYMTIEQFVSEFGKKVLDMDEDDKDAYHISPPWVIKAYAAETDDIEEDVTDMSNGRFDIFKSYMSVWNLWGHDDMEAVLPNGDMAVHAHNSFLQVAHDHGIIFGIYFGLFIGYVIILSLIRAYRSGKVYEMFCPVLLVCFCMASLVEWIMHPANPFGLSIFLAMMPLFIKDYANEKSD